MIADHLALITDHIHRDYSVQSPTVLCLGVLSFAVQIYADFCGYTNIARGCAQLLGFRLSKNFRFPYFAKSFRDFWHRWHISLSTWFRDYVYIPLGGNRLSPARNAFNIILTFTVSGLWHGANITFILWGALHGILLVIENKIFGKAKKSALWAVLVFAFVGVLFTLFRSPTIFYFLNYMRHIFTTNPTLSSLQPTQDFTLNKWLLLPLLVFVATEVLKAKKKNLSPVKFNYALNFLVGAFNIIVWRF